MKARKVYQICLVFCGLLLSLSGIACLVVATLLNHDSDLKMNHASTSRTYGTQYWLGLPLIAFGGLLMLVSPSLHKRKRMALVNLFVCIPLLTCALMAAVLHGTAYTYFLSEYQKRLFLETNDYSCSDLVVETTTCKCTALTQLPTNFLAPQQFSVSCSQQNNVVAFHGSLLAFSALTFALLLGAMATCIVFLMHFFNPQLETNRTSSGQENAGFSHGRDRGHSASVQIDPSTSPHSSHTSLHAPQDPPPSYESLMTSRDVTSHGVTSRSAANDVTSARNRALLTNADRVRVRYRGQSSSRVHLQIPEGREQNESSPSNEVFSANENEMREEPVAVESTPLARSEAAEGTTNRENTEEASEERTSPGVRNRTSVGARNEHNIQARPGRGVRDTLLSIEHSSQIASQESETDNTGPVQDNTRVGANLETIAQTSRDGIDPRNTRPSDEVVSQGRADLWLSQHQALEQASSSNSEDGVYIDITQANAAHRSILTEDNRSSSTDPHIADRYTGQTDMNSVSQIRSQIVHEEDDNADENVIHDNLNEGEFQNIAELPNPTTDTDPVGSTEEATDSVQTREPLNDPVIPSAQELQVHGDHFQSALPESNEFVRSSSFNPPTVPERRDERNSVGSLETISI